MSRRQQAEVEDGFRADHRRVRHRGRRQRVHQPCQGRRPGLSAEIGKCLDQQSGRHRPRQCACHIRRDIALAQHCDEQGVVGDRRRAERTAPVEDAALGGERRGLLPVVDEEVRHRNGRRSEGPGQVDQECRGCDRTRTSGGPTCQHQDQDQQRQCDLGMAVVLKLIDVRLGYDVAKIDDSARQHRGAQQGPSTPLQQARHSRLVWRGIKGGRPSSGSMRRPCNPDGTPASQSRDSKRGACSVGEGRTPNSLQCRRLSLNSTRSIRRVAARSRRTAEHGAMSVESETRSPTPKSLGAMAARESFPKSDPVTAQRPARRASPVTTGAAPRRRLGQ